MDPIDPTRAGNRSPSSGPLRLLVIPGLRDSGPAHWQTWLERRAPGAVRVVQRDWHDADLQRWSGRIDSMLERAGPGPFLAVAHSFGVLALVEHLGRRADTPVVAALLVAPADPGKFGIGECLPQTALPRPSTLMASSNDPWLPWPVAGVWARRWGCPVVNLGAAGHVNAESGFGPFPRAEQWVRARQALWLGAGSRQGGAPFALAA